MSHSIRQSLLDDLSRLPDLLVPGNDILQMLVNCYWLCRMEFRRINDATTNDGAYWRIYDDLAAEAASILERSRDRTLPFALVDPGELRDCLTASGPVEATVRCAAVLRALSTHVAGDFRSASLRRWRCVNTSAALGDVAILISPAPSNVIRDRIERLREPGKKPTLPRLVHEISDMRENYHPLLHISPLEVEDCRLIPIDLDRTLEELIASRVARNALKIAVTPLTCDAAIRLKTRPDFPSDVASRFIVDAIEDEDAQAEFVKTVLARCRDERISILVLPELRVPPKLQNTIKKFLSGQSLKQLVAGNGLIMVVAGSWHVEGVTDELGEMQRRFWNRSVVMDYRGEIAWIHDKLTEYVITADNVAQDPALRTQFGLSEKGGKEAIRRGRTIEFCDCKLGRISVAICVGFFHDPIEKALRASGANVFLVPAMSPDMRPLEERARTLVRSQRASTFAANCGTIAHDGTSKRTRSTAACFYLLPWADSGPIRMSCPSETGDYLHVFDLSTLDI
jgi:predicted amidohydrolase